jgi:hypothetical protein
MTDKPDALALAREALTMCEAHLEERAEAEYFPDRAAPVPNDEMRLLVDVQAALAAGPTT